MNNLNKAIDTLLKVTESSVGYDERESSEYLNEVSSFLNRQTKKLSGQDLTRVDMYQWYMNLVQNFQVPVGYHYSVMASLREMETSMTKLKAHEGILVNGLMPMDWDFRSQVASRALVADVSTRGIFGDTSRAFLRQLYFHSKLNMGCVDSAKEILSNLNRDYPHLKEYTENGIFADPEEFSNLRDSNVFGADPEPVKEIERNSLMSVTAKLMMDLAEDNEVLDSLEGFEKSVGKLKGK